MAESDNGGHDGGSDNGGSNGGSNGQPNMPYWGNPYSSGFGGYGYNYNPNTSSSSLGNTSGNVNPDDLAGAKGHYEEGALERYQHKTEFDQEHSWEQQGIQAAMYAGGGLVVGGILGSLVGSLTKNSAINSEVAKLESRGYEKKGNVFEKIREDGSKVTKKMPKAKGHVTKMAGLGGLLMAGGGALFGVMNAH